MKKNHIRISTGNYSPPEFIFIAAIVLVISIFQVIIYPLLFSVLIVLCLAVLFTSYGLEIDTEKCIYQEYLSTFGIRYSFDTYAYKYFEYLYINSSNYSQRLNSRGSSSSVKFLKYNGYLLSDEGEQIHIYGSKNRNAVLKKLEVLSTFLDLEIVVNDD